MSVVERVWFVWLMARAGTGVRRREPAWGLIEFAIGALVFAVGAAVGLKVLGSDLATFFTELGKSFSMPAGGLGSS